ncbi:acyl-CoA synthetase [Amylibacter sp.]|jgi:fatty-acyl-CoA synthase|nr:acyl-CoA synthetase [Amylibacter sp.]MDB2333038.1 acyl-CoA synthetase [Amylibacter sp.]MDB2405183.1 acyl-CoA synthetase [bacterium]MDB2547064.1 acyl-CoA synthetase [Amylibacter sp.]MDB2706018.1 acyl-CoA synthetase [bacterium]
MTNPFNKDLDQNPANYQPLTPLTFLERAASVFPDQIAVIHGNLRQNYSELYRRSVKLASSLNKIGIKRGDTISVLLPNTPAMLEAHYGVPMSGAILHSINTRLDASTISFQLNHAETKVFIIDSEYMALAQEALKSIDIKPIIIEYDDLEYLGKKEEFKSINYEEFIDQGDDAFNWLMPENEWDAISINYTSGTTGHPKGVVTHHRGAYLLAQGNALTISMPKHSIYLWTLPMFHCNGWCFPWTMSAISGTHVCLRQVRADKIWHLISEHKVSHLCGAPIVMSVIVNALQSEKRKLNHTVEFLTAAAPPPEKILTGMNLSGFNVTHLYGLTETYGPAVVNDWQENWSKLPEEEQAKLKSRQGVRYLPLEGLDVLDPATMKPVPRDGKSLGEVMFRGNVVMKGYFKNPKATNEAFKGGWFHSGDLGVMHPDGYLQLKDRSKDIIISGGENISSIEIEEVLYSHNSVEIAAVVAMPHEKWGETPCAFVQIAEGHCINENDLMVWCKKFLASYKIPKKFIIKNIPRTSTGKIQKFLLRDEAKILK